jgi:hypothetical protein
MGRFASRRWLRSNVRMTPRFMTILTGRDLPTIRHARATPPSIITEKTSPTLPDWSSRFGYWRPCRRPGGHFTKTGTVTNYRPGP